MTFREITLSDIPAIFEVRVSTDENNFSYEELSERGITYESVSEKLNTSCKGWLCEMDKKTVGFIIIDKSNGEVWVIAILPEYINLGIGSKLLEIGESLLVAAGNKRLWLTTDANKSLRAYSFYKKHGWKEWKQDNAILFMQKSLL